MERHHLRKPPARPLVLVLDGHDDGRELNAIALTFLGFETVHVDDGEDAFVRAWQTGPDVILAQVSPPTSGAWTLIHDLKRDPRTCNIPVAILTDDAQPWVRQRAEDEGCAAVFLKPCLPDQLALGLREVLNRDVHHEHASARR